jgi:hypothetical protein
LRIADVRTGDTREIARGIGRALQPRLSPAAAISFTRRDSANVRWIELYDVKSGMSSRVVRSLPENEYHVWLPTGVLISTRGSSLYVFNPRMHTDWVLMTDLSAFGVKGASRLAVSDDGRYLAIVGSQ